LRPKVSVIIPTYKRTTLLQRSIESVLNQTFDDFEILIIDGARSDLTKELVLSYGDGRIRYVPQKGKGIANARNLGVQRARGEFIAFLDDDDAWEPQKLELQVERFKELAPSYGLSYMAFNYYHLEKGKILGTKYPIAKGYVYPHLLADNITGTSTIMVRRECFREVGLFRENFATCEDWDMWLRISKRYLFDAVGTPLVNYSIHTGQFSFSRYLEGRYEMIKRHLDIRNNPRILSYHLLQIGIIEMIGGEKKKGAQHILKALSLNPTMKGNIHKVLGTITDVRVRIYIMKFLGKL